MLKELTYISAVDGEFFDNIQVLDHLAELIKRYLSIEILISLDNCAINQLLQLDIIEVAAYHHFQNGEQFSI